MVHINKQPKLMVFKQLVETVKEHPVQQAHVIDLKKPPGFAVMLHFETEHSPVMIKHSTKAVPRVFKTPGAYLKTLKELQVLHWTVVKDSIVKGSLPTHSLSPA